MKKIAVLYSEYSPTIDAIKMQLSGIEVCCFQNYIEELTNYDLIVLCNYNKSVNFNALNVHHSLLPAFAGDEPEKEAILTGVKVTGITVFYTKPERIIAQYPIFIENDMHFDDLEIKMNNLEQVIYPIIIDKILKSEPFEIKDLLNTNTKGCGKCCSKCGGH